MIVDSTIHGGYKFEVYVLAERVDTPISNTQATPEVWMDFSLRSQIVAEWKYDLIKLPSPLPIQLMAGRLQSSVEPSPD
ncbi:hypothetical protein TSMEX_009196 [Taenia solium]|eukprot:TsM_001151700 transcript=TsM_001151700 gene=TsM_001151700